MLGDNSNTQPVNNLTPEQLKANLEIRKNDPKRLKVPTVKLRIESNRDILLIK